MAKYESPCQVLGLFMGAVLVSCCVIYILTLEANKRYGDGQSQDENIKGEKFSDTHAPRSKRSATYESMDDTDNVASKRLMTWAGDKNPNDFMDWSVDSEGNFFIDIPLKSTELQFSNDNNDINKDTYRVGSARDKEDIDEYDLDEDDTRYASDLSENILTEGLNHRKIRNVEEKIAWLKEDDQIVEEIVRQFCPKPPTTTASPPTVATTIEVDSGEENDVGWHDVGDDMVVFEEDTDERQGSWSDLNKDVPKINHMDDLPPLLVERDVNVKNQYPWTKPDSRFGNRKPPGGQPQVQCQSERDILMTVAITTIVNFIFFGFIMVAKYWICNSCDGCERENFDEDCTPIVSNEDYNGDEFITSCNCMDEGCPNSGSPPYDRIRMPYKRFFNEHSSAGRLDVVGAAINEKKYVASRDYHSPHLSVNCGDIVTTPTTTALDYLGTLRRNGTPNQFYENNLMEQTNFPMSNSGMLYPALHSPATNNLLQTETNQCSSGLPRSSPRDFSLFAKSQDFSPNQDHIII